MDRLDASHNGYSSVAHVDPWNVLLADQQVEDSVRKLEMALRCSQSANLDKTEDHYHEKKHGSPFVSHSETLRDQDSGVRRPPQL